MAKKCPKVSSKVPHKLKLVSGPFNQQIWTCSACGASFKRHTDKPTCSGGYVAGKIKLGEAAEQYIRDWRVCDCGYEVEGRFTERRYNTECGHALECDYYLADAVLKHLEKLEASRAR